jgi:hypothetical protein
MDDESFVQQGCTAGWAMPLRPCRTCPERDVIIQDGVLVAGVPIAGQATSFALGAGDVFLQGGTLRTPSLDPLIINVGGNYTQGPGGTLALGVAGVNGAQGSLAATLIPGPT